MKAIQLIEPGGVENLVSVDLPIPVPQTGEVLIKVKAISINPVDIKTRKGLALYNNLKEHPPVILGWDISGEVVSAGPEVTGFKAGDEVFGMINFPGHGKAYAEYVVAPSAHLARKPGQITHQEAAASSLALLTAWQVLVHQAKLQQGERVLMQAAAGGVGHFGVQVAKVLGAHVIGTGTDAKAAFIKNLGADEFIDYTKGPLEKGTEPVDLVFDAVGGDGPLRSLGLIKEGGRMFCIAGGATDEVKGLASARNIHITSYLVQSNGEHMTALAELLAKGAIKPFISEEYKLEEVGKAHQQIETGRTKGKLVLVP